MNVDSNGVKELNKLNHRPPDEKKEVENWVAGYEESQEEDNSKVNGIPKDVRDVHGGSTEALAVLQMPQQQPQGPVLGWERFLHLRSLKVLLVENDDSTRHVVTALLRNCSYEVIQAAHGLQAWKIMEDLNNQIDLVLTEVIMPGLSGIGLLCKIMSHKTRKNIPVIMMSTHDSMGLVFKCLSKGAVDFLVKPIRKNELKNLWQHVWRRCHSSSGSGSESGTQTQKSVKSKSIEKSENDAGSNDDDDNGSIGLNVGDGSDDGSGTQSSWTKQAVEVDSPRPVFAWDQVAECPGSTSAQVIHSNAEQTSNKWVPLSAAKECQEQDERLVLFPDNAAMGKELEITVPRKINSQLESPDEVAIKLADAKQNNLYETGSSKFNEQIDGQLDLNSESPSSKIKPEAANLIGAITKAIHLQDSICYETPNRLSKTLDVNNNAISAAKELPCLELGKRFRRTKESGTTDRDDRNVLRRSDSSAFSRYNTVSNANTARSGNIGSNSPIDNCSGAMKKGSVCNIRSHSNGDPPNQCSNIGTSNIDMGSTTNNAFNKPVALRNKSAASSTVKCSSFQPCAPQQVVSDNADDIVATRVMGQARGTHQEFQIQRLPHHHFVQHKQRELQQKPCGHDDLSLGQKALVALHFESSSILGGAVEVNAGNCSVNGSASGSNHGSSTAANAGGRNIECDNAGRSGSDDARRSGNGDASGSRRGNRWDVNKFSRREAALTKFRQKRKERCFRKKVRYKSRKKLAEQRPRVRGQFVRQMPNESTSGGTDS